MTVVCEYCGGTGLHTPWCKHEAARRDALRKPVKLEGMHPPHLAAPPLPDPLLAVIDRQLEIERKAVAWDSLRGMLLRHPGPCRVTMAPDGTSWSVAQV